MKRTLIPLALLPALLAAPACHNPVNPAEGEVTAPLMIGVDILDESGHTRGMIEADENRLNNLNIFIYDESAGLIHSSGYFTEFDNLCFDNLIEGRTYRVLALANAGRKSAPGRLADALEMAVATDDCESLGEGLPMAGAAPLLFGAVGDGYTLHMHLSRLLARYAFSLDLSRMQGSLELSSVEVHNVAGRVKPWAEASKARPQEICDGDALTEEEQSLLVAGGSVRLLVPENCQGDLLEDNDDPWAKTPENLEGMEDCCTYLEVHARYRHEGYTVNDLTYRFYLGEDNVGNFDIRRNTAYLLTLALTDTNAVVASSWKVERGGVEDFRSLAFDRIRDTLLQNAQVVRSLFRAPSPFGYRIVPGEGFAEAGLSVTDNGDGTCRIRSGAIPGHSATGRLWAESWDGAKRSWCDVTVMNWDTVLTIHNTRNVMWPGDTARLTASIFFENNRRTVDVTDVAQWSVSGGSAAWFAGSAVGQDTVRLYGDTYGAVRVTASHLGRTDSVRAAVSEHVGVGCSGPDPIYVPTGAEVPFDCYVVFASGDTLHDPNEFYWAMTNFTLTLYAEPELPYGTFRAAQAGTERVRFTLKRNWDFEAYKTVIVVEE